MTDLVTDMAWASFAKYGEELCGDQVAVIGGGGAAPVLVMADGLGSGVKACILATLTAKIFATMIARSMPLEECAATVAATLPVCGARKIAYSTFSIIKTTNCSEAEIIQYDNPGVVLLRNGKHVDFPVATTEADGKKILTSKIPLQENDVLVAVSDGALHAGEGETLNYSWERNAVIRYLEDTRSSRLSAKSICAVLRDQCRRLYAGRPGDDVTACAVAVRRRTTANVLIGPPREKSDDAAMMEQFLAEPGMKIVCGGTTTGIAAAHLGTEAKPDKTSPDPDIPPTFSLDGIDLATEGAVTIARVAAYVKDYGDEFLLYDDWCFADDGAARMARMLLDEATDVSFTVGCAVNPAHHAPGLPPGLAAKPRIVEELAANLEKAGKTVRMAYW